MTSLARIVTGRRRPTLVLLHGITGSAVFLAGPPTTGGPRLPVVAVDARGHGLSPP